MKLYETEQIGEVMVVVPHFGAGGFRYREFHMASSSLQSQLGGPDIKHLVIDLFDANYFGSEFIGMMLVCSKVVRSKGGKAVICNVSEQMGEVLGTMSLSKIIPIFTTREAALSSLE